ncbi:Inherit from proNOG: -acetyltransferase [Seminavis robusta]|uniref:Inherit from proNOG: -acetyltransferase n=1 Tax=Seminavis robusta TaxID=568900 RepID=A0A9N8EBG4_9STRA|nr:Inherit from proNOG: -acetyltransferase [Seminavis robusta]|eukprot:Sro923_g220700.1 Inherit from proNOG: -acetyltransferase (233) ;mRNA; f:15074-15772
MIPEVVKNWIPRLPMTAPSLVGRHVRTDPLDLSKDIPLLWDALGGNDESINERLKWYGFADLGNEQDLSDLLERFHQPATGCCVNVFRLVPSNQVAGMASYMATRPEHGSTEVGLVAHGPAMAQSPAATEAHYLLAQHAFETMGYRRYEWKCDSNNAPSNKAARRYGFTYEGQFRQHIVTAKGNNRDTNWYSMLDSEWPQRKKAMEAWLHPSNFDQDGKQKHQLQHFQESNK